jgi:hypothetical protein
VLYGSEALGGVVNVIPAEVPDAVGRESFMHSGIELYGESVNGEFGTALRAEGASSSFGWRGFVTGRRASDFHTPDGELDNTGFGAINAQLVGGTRGTWGSTQLRIAHYGGEFKLLEAGENPDRRRAGRGGGTGAEDAGRPRPARRHVPAEQRAPRDEASVPAALAGGGGRGSQRDGRRGGGGGVRARAQHVSLDVLAHHSLSKKVRGTIGASGTLQSHESEGELQVVPNAKMVSGGLLAFEGLTAVRHTSCPHLVRCTPRSQPTGCSSAPASASRKRPGSSTISPGSA